MLHKQQQQQQLNCGWYLKILSFYFVCYLPLQFVYCHRAYPDGCLLFPKSYYNFNDNLSVPLSSLVDVKSTEQYWITQRLGTGKFSDVFEAIDTEDSNANNHHDLDMEQDQFHKDYDIKGNVVVLKCLKPIHPKKIKREILVMKRCQERKLPNIVNLLGIVLSSTSTSVSSSNAVINNGVEDTKYYKNNKNNNQLQTDNRITLVLQHAGKNCRWLCHPKFVANGERKRYRIPSSVDNAIDGPRSNNIDSSDSEPLWLSNFEIQYYVYQLLRAVDGMHSAGIMHRDIKPRNILINTIVSLPVIEEQVNDCQKQSSLVLIDFGLSDFYLPNALYSVRVSSKYYKSPELLCNIQNYDYSIDMWSIGCILASLLFRTNVPFFGSIVNDGWPKYDYIRNNLDDHRTTDRLNQLYSIISMLGIPKFLSYIEKYKISFPNEIEQTVRIWKKRRDKSQQTQISNENTDADDDDDSDDDENDNVDSFIDKVLQYCNVDETIRIKLQQKRRNNGMQQQSRLKNDLENGIELVTKLLVYDPDDRFTAKQAMQHKYFQNLFAAGEDTT